MADTPKGIELTREGSGKKTVFTQEQANYLQENLKGWNDIVKRGIITNAELQEAEKLLTERLNSVSESLESLVSVLNTLLNDISGGARSRNLAQQSIRKLTGSLESLLNGFQDDIMSHKDYVQARKKLRTALFQAEESLRTAFSSSEDLKKAYEELKKANPNITGTELREALESKGFGEKDVRGVVEADIGVGYVKSAQKHLDDFRKNTIIASNNIGKFGDSFGGFLSKFGIKSGDSIQNYIAGKRAAWAKAETKRPGSGDRAAQRYARRNRGNLLSSLTGITAAGIWGTLISNFLAVNKAATDVKRTIGEWNVQLASNHFGLATTRETLETINSLAKETKLNVTLIFTGEELGRIAEAQKLLGMTAEQANALGIYSKLNNQSLEEYRNNLYDGLKAGVAATGSAIALGEAEKNAASASNAIKISIGGAANNLGKAAALAASLGMSLEDIQNISRNLMNFESSIEAEMQAQLMTGRNLNLAKARELALNNDLAGVAEEIARQGVTMQEYGRMDYIQQESLAKALGMSREQMANMLVLRALEAGQSADAVAKTMKMNSEQVKAISIQQQIKDTITRIADILTPVLQSVVYVLGWVLKPITFIAGLFNKLPEVAKWVLAIGVALRVWGVRLGVVRGLLTSIGSLGTRIGGIFGNITRERQIRAAGKGGLLDSLRGRGKNVADTATQSKGGGGLVNTIKSFGKLNWKEMLSGAAAMAVMAGALWILAKACQEFEKVTWESLGMAGAALIGLAVAMRVVGKAMAGGISEILIGVGVLALLGLVTGLLVDPITKLVTALNGGDGVMDKLLGLALGLVALGPAMLVFAATGGVGLGMLDQVAGAFTRLSEAFTSLSKANFTAIAAGFRTVAESVKSLSSAVSELSVGKLLVATGIGRITGVRGIEETGIQENASAVRVNTATVEGGVPASTNLAEIERKLDMINQTIIKSRPDWNWLEFNKEQQLNNTHGLAYRG